jgi:hypothetical protein
MKGPWWICWGAVLVASHVAVATLGDTFGSWQVRHLGNKFQSVYVGGEHRLQMLAADLVFRFGTVNQSWTLLKNILREAPTDRQGWSDVVYTELRLGIVEVESFDEPQKAPHFAAAKLACPRSALNYCGEARLRELATDFARTSHFPQHP